MMSQSQSFGSYLSPMSEFSDLTLVKPSSTLDFKDTLRGLDASLPDSAWTFECQQAKDQGTPSLTSNATVHVFILDQNDNVPAVIYPSASMGSVSHQRMPRSAKMGHLVTKVTAVDADSGHNAWISYRLAEATDSSLFAVNLYTGEVRTKRSVSEQDDASQRLLIEIKDNGEPVQSTTVTVDILIEDGLHEPISDFRQKATEKDKKNSKLTFYLILSLASVSVLSFLTFFILLIKCARNSRGNTSCCIRRDSDGYKNPNRNLQIQLNTDGPIKYVEVLGGDMMSQSQSFGSYLSPMSEFSDLTLVKPSSTLDFKDTLRGLDASLPDSAWTFECQQVRTKRSVSEQDDASQRLLIEIKDNGEPVQSTTVTVDILIEDGLHEPISDFRQKVTEKDKKNGKITFYLILSLASVSVLSLLTLFILLIKCARNSRGNTSCCIRRDSDGYKNPNRNLQIQLNTDGPIKYVEVLGGDMMSQSQSFGSYLSPMSEFSDLTLVKPSSTLDFKDTLRGLDASLPDSAWTFECQQIRYTIPEELKEGSVVGNIAKDLRLDVQDLANRKLRIASESGNPYFIVDLAKGELLVNGKITVIGKLDYEERKSYTFDVSAKDKGHPQLQGDSSVHIDILDENDNAPEILLTSLPSPVKENAPVGTVVALINVKDLDSNDNGKNDNIPAVIYPSASMGSVSHQRMPRSAKMGHLVTKVTAVDADSGHNAWISYRLAEATDSSLFDVNLYTGEVRTKRSVSEQDDASQRLLIEIKDNGEPVQSTTVTIQLNTDGPIKYVEVLGGDMMSQSQSFGSYLSPMSEFSDLTLVKPSSTLDFKDTLRGLDASLPDSAWTFECQQIQLNTDGPIKYVEVLGGDMMSQSQSFGSYLSPMSEFSDLTLVKPSSTLDFKDTLRGLDASLPDSAWTFECQQLNTDGPIKYVEVLGGDMMSQSQSFGSYLSPMSEFSDLTLVKPSSTLDFKDTLRGLDASLPDSAWTFECQQIQLNTDGPIKYVEVLGGDMMSQSQSFGSYLSPMSEFSDLTLVKPSSTLDFKDTLRGLDASLPDSAWTFECQQRMPRSAKMGHLVTKVTAVDADSGHNAWISYRLAEATDSSLFAVNLYTGEVRTKRSVSEQDDASQRLLIEIKDNGEPVQSTTVTIQLNTDGPIKYVEVLGGDMMSQSQSFGSYLSPMSEFSDLTLVKPSSTLDFKDTLRGLDASLPDSAWTFECQQPSPVREDVPNGTVVALIRVRDPDTGDNASDGDIEENSKITYSVLESKVQDVTVASYVYINSDNGSIFSMSAFDYEKTKVFQILVQAKDQGSPPLTSNATVHVFVLDQNDNVPAVIYPSSSMGSVSHQRMPRSAKMGHLVTKVTAVDADSGHNAWISYRLAEATDSSLFAVNLYTGEVRTKRSVSEQDDASQRLLIEIKDNGEPVQSTTVTVDILIEDGLHEPISDFRQKSVEKDKKNSKLTFYLILSLASVSVLSLLTFFILLIKCARNSRGNASCCIRRDSDGYKNPNRNLQIQLNTDGPIKYVEVLGGDMMSQSQSFGSYLSPMSEFSDLTLVKPSSTLDFKDTLRGLDASLPDSAWTFECQQNAEVSYVFDKYTPEDVLKLFSVDSATGEIHVKGELDREVANVYDITIIARDRGTPAMEGSCNVKVEIMDVNDNMPTIVINSLSNVFKEDVESGTVIAVITVKDEDAGKNGEVSLQIPPGLPFKLSPPFEEHYTLMTDGLLDRETVAEYTITVTATDSGSPPRSQKESFVLSLSDVNDNAPLFTQADYTVEITENNAPNTPLLTVSASDPDMGENGSLSFSILDTEVRGSPVSSYVYINAEKGHIYALRPLDHEQMNAFQIHVQVRDSGSPVHTSNATVHVFVQDENDHAPSVLYPVLPTDGILQLTVPRSAGVGHLVQRLICVDGDSGHNAWLFYSLSGRDADFFHVGPHTGELRVARKLAQEEADLVLSFTVLVQDNGKPAISTSVQVNVTLVEKVTDVFSQRRTTASKKSARGADATFYLILSLSCVSVVSFLTFALLVARWFQGRRQLSCFGYTFFSKHTVHKHRDQDLQLQINMDGPLRYIEVVGDSKDGHKQTLGPCYSTLSSVSDFVFVKSPITSQNAVGMSLSKKLFVNSVSKQKPPNNDWRLPPNQRPGPSGAGPLPEGAGVVAGTGPWPNPPTEAEQLQALMAGANAVSEATATMGPRYNAQYVPDYRQNVYIPGSTATLTANPQQPPQQALPPPQAMPPTDAPKAAQTPASKKKSTKKDKK
ncbi:hypothetical protein ACEWY4_009248 [Coilia grayii]|uniref:Cadherin domain-containing protein n=1 Tax=Coilia grayii TaxID=363190 RepID=A0ABD1K5W0_9TELE